MEDSIESRQARRKRPALLLVLCILTFIGSGFNVLGNLFSLFISHAVDSAVQIAGEDYLEGSKSILFGSALEVLRATAEHAREIVATKLILGLISLLGAILMFHLRRSGFYAYTAAQILMLFVLPYFMGFSAWALNSMAGSAFVSLIFIILYAVNLKSMR